MTDTTPDERTLDVLVRNSRAPRRAPAVARVVGPDSANLGTAFVGIGAAVVVAIRGFYGFAWFIGQWNAYPEPVLAIAAWIVLLATLLTTFICTRMVGDKLPTWLFALFLSGLGGAAVLDLASIWELHDIGGHGTVALIAVMSLLLVLTLRSPAELLIAVGVGALGLVVAILLNTPFFGEEGFREHVVAPQITAVAFAVLPVVIGVVVVQGFRRMVQLELDRVLVQSTVSAPRFAVGMLASEELARLDLAAEDLLDSVASGKTALPLTPKIASLAAQLATELRLHLIEGRRETWLHHAITESELLGRVVTLEDKGALAGLLDPQQRDGLLAAIWLLVADTANPADARTVEVSIGPIAPRTGTVSSRTIPVPIVVATTGVNRNRVDPSAWDALRRVGGYSDSTQNGSLRVDIECFVDNPAEM
jgi:hypothetical protein